MANKEENSLLHDLSVPSALAFRGWDPVIDGSRSFRLYYDASQGGFGATLEQEQV